MGCVCEERLGQSGNQLATTFTLEDVKKAESLQALIFSTGEYFNDSKLSIFFFSTVVFFPGKKMNPQKIINRFSHRF